jgi:hypothetical protein
LRPCKTQNRIKEFSSRFAVLRTGRRVLLIKMRS